MILRCQQLYQSIAECSTVVNTVLIVNDHAIDEVVHPWMVVQQEPLRHMVNVEHILSGRDGNSGTASGVTLIIYQGSLEVSSNGT